jgi:diketogulonate reductase-like aldo/keto reductase
MEYFTLSNGLRIPAVGSGTNSFAKTDRVYNGSTKEVCSAIQAGYRFFDTAEGYGNEEAIGSGVIESGVGREAMFLCTKMSKREERPMTREDTAAAIERSLAKLKTDYIDLYLLHFPREDPAETAEIWKGFEEAYRKGTLKAIGVCNFQPEQLEALLSVCEVPPMVDQVRCNPDDWNAAAVACAQKNGGYRMAWGPLRFDAKHREPLAAIGARYGKTWAQTVLRYQYQRGVITIPKSHSFEHQKENLDLFDFALTEAEMTEIAAL